MSSLEPPGVSRVRPGVAHPARLLIQDSLGSGALAHEGTGCGEL